MAVPQQYIAYPYVGAQADVGTQMTDMLNAIMPLLMMVMMMGMIMPMMKGLTAGAS